MFPNVVQESDEPLAVVVEAVEEVVATGVVLAPVVVAAAVVVVSASVVVAEGAVVVPVQNGKVL